ncbi:MAG: Haloacid dehalogenase domain protein hydrolase [Oscillospiraceae bacterium]|nr:Haloacid dehalogenase domain protein hydrolase [Oscillospiraceae bacterium]
MNNTKLVVFDLDGTLNKTDLFSVPAHQKALLEFGITDKSEQFIMDTFGSRAEDYVPLLFSNPDIDSTKSRSYLDKVAAYEKDFIKQKGKPFDGVVSSLECLKQDGFLLAVCSNASERYIRLCLESLDLIRFIDAIQPLLSNMTKVDTLKLLLSKVQPQHAVMVGDRIFDWEAAKGNNIPFIGCMYGYNPEEIKNAEYTVESAFQLYEKIVSVL